jgi:serine protease Do
MSITNTIERTKSATFALIASDPIKGTPVPRGTCFFISKSGYILTAHHVVREIDFNNVCLHKPPALPWEDSDWSTAITIIQFIRLVRVWENFDLALMKADFDANGKKEWAKVRDSFPYLSISFNQYKDGNDVYSFGYPLSDFQNITTDAGTFTLANVRERVTSAIISSTKEQSGPISHPKEPKHYVLDKAFNYGNSGGPIIDQRSGKAIAVVVRFQPFIMKQPSGDHIFLPSQYGISSSLANIEEEIKPYINHTDATKKSSGGRRRTKQRKKRKYKES